MRGIKYFLGVLVLLPFAAASLSAGPASAATQRTVRTKAEWQAAIAQVPEQGTGCYHATYPALQWRAVKCAVAPKLRMAPVLPSGSATHAAPATVGDGHDYSARVSGRISQATGTFPDVSSKITEKGKVGNEGSKVTNGYSLQLNTQFFSGSPACAKSGTPAKCLAWQQFVYAYKGCGPSCVFMQYWLIDYNAKCPSGWITYKTGSNTNDCYTNSSAAEISTITAADLATVKLVGSATAGGNDKLSVSVGSGQATLVTGKDSKVDLAKFWNTTEWNVFGDGGGGEAYFGANTTLEAQTVLKATSSSAPTCVKEGFTAETNNLNLAHTPALGSEPSPTMASRQTNGSTGTASCAVAA